MQGTHLEIYWCRVGEDRTPRRSAPGSRLLFVGGRRLLASRGQHDAERACMDNLPGFRSQVELVGGGRYPLPSTNQIFPGRNPDWGCKRLMRFAIPDTVPPGKYSVKFIRNDGEQITTDDVIVPAVASPIAALERVTTPVVLSPGQLLEGKSIDLTGMLSQTAITLAPGCRLRDVQIINPYGVGIGGIGAEDVSIEYVDNRSWQATDIKLNRPVTRVFTNRFFSLGDGGYSAGEFGFLYSGSDCLSYRSKMKGYNRGPLHFQRQAPLTRNIYCETDIEDILPSWSESEGIFWECSECEFPAVIANNGRQLIVAMRSNIAASLASKQSWVANVRTEEIARIIESTRGGDGNYLLTLDRSFGPVVSGDLRVGAMAVDNTLIRCRGRHVKNLVSIAGGCADHSYIDCLADDSEEFISVVKTDKRVPRPRQEPSVDYPFEWRPLYLFNGQHRCNRGYYVQPGGVRQPPKETLGIGAPGEFVEGAAPPGVRE